MPKLLLSPFTTGALLALVLQIARQPLPAVMANGIEAAPALSLEALQPVLRAASVPTTPYGHHGSGKHVLMRESDKR